MCVCITCQQIGMGLLVSYCAPNHTHTTPENKLSLNIAPSSAICRRMDSPSGHSELLPHWVSVGDREREREKKTVGL